MHIGNIIKQKTIERKKTVVWLARNLPCSRTNIYKIFNKPTIDTGTLLRISTLLEFDFFSLYSKEMNNNL